MDARISASAEARHFKSAPEAFDFDGIAINGEPVDDEAIVASFERIEEARGDISLTYFEFNTLAAVDIFMRENVDVMILEVGLGGRLDAVNVFDADCAVVTSIDLDHMDFLGPDRESIGHEKAGIMRPSRPVIISDPLPPQSVLTHAASLGADLRQSLGPSRTGGQATDSCQNDRSRATEERHREHLAGEF